jgi:plastocyanin
MSIWSRSLLTALLLWAGCSAGLPATSAGELKTVVINHFKFEPDTLTIHVGDTVEWKNLDMFTHTATADDRRTFDSGQIANGSSWRFTFKRKGVYGYSCTLHPNMKGTLVVN